MGRPKLNLSIPQHAYMASLIAKLDNLLQTAYDSLYFSMRAPIRSKYSTLQASLLNLKNILIEDWLDAEGYQASPTQSPYLLKLPPEPILEPTHPSTHIIPSLTPTQLHSTALYNHTYNTFITLLRLPHDVLASTPAFYKLYLDISHTLAKINNTSTKDFIEKSKSELAASEYVTVTNEEVV